VRRPKAAEAGPDPRIERSKRVILRAALEELGEAGYGAFAIERVAARAGVGKSTIYRHWTGKLALIADAYLTLHQEEGPDISTGDARERLERIVRHVADIVAGSTFSRCIPAMIEGAERDRALRRFHHRFQKEARRPLDAVVAEAVGAGLLPAGLDPESAASALLGIVFYRRLMTAEPLDPGAAGRLIDSLFGPRPGGPGRGARAATRPRAGAGERPRAGRRSRA
jgi:AcrR family transcriptional regulator